LRDYFSAMLDYVQKGIAVCSSAIDSNIQSSGAAFTQ